MKFTSIFEDNGVRHTDSHSISSSIRVVVKFRIRFHLVYCTSNICYEFLRVVAVGHRYSKMAPRRSHSFAEPPARFLQKNVSQGDRVDTIRMSDFINHRENRRSRSVANFNLRHLFFDALDHVLLTSQNFSSILNILFFTDLAKGSPSSSDCCSRSTSCKVRSRVKATVPNHVYIELMGSEFFRSEKNY